MTLAEKIEKLLDDWIFERNRHITTGDTGLLGVDIASLVGEHIDENLRALAEEIHEVIGGGQR